MLTISSLLKQTANSKGDRVAIQHGDRIVTYFELYNMVRETVVFLEEQGFSYGDTVILVLANTPDCISCFLALACLSVKVVPVDPASVSLHFLEQVYKDLMCSAIICDVKKIENDLLTNDFLKHAKIIDLMLPITNTAKFETELLTNVESEDIFLYHYTSGSTGKMKAAIHSQGNLIRGAYIYIKTYDIKDNDIVLVAVPVAHSFGLVAGLFVALVSNTTLVLIDRFIPERLIQTVHKLSVTILIATPLIYDLLYRSKIVRDWGLSSLRLCLSSGDQLQTTTAKGFWDKFGKAIYKVYGTTETGVIAAQWPRSVEWPEKSVGCPLSNIVVRVVDDSGNDLAPNQIGNLKVNTPTMFSGYWNNLASSDTVLKDEWYTTGDLGWQDNEGHLYLYGRKDTFINIGGKKVNPVEVESVLLLHPMIAEALVFGEEDELIRNIRVCAKIVTRGSLTANEVLSFCREKLANHEVPSEIEFVSELPKTNLGKIRRGYFESSPMEKK